MKKGFTLIELLAVIILLGILVTIGIPVIDKAINRSRDQSTLVEKKIIIDAVKRYMIDYDIDIDSQDTISIKALKEAGYLSNTTLEDKETGENLDEKKVLISWNETSNKYTYEFFINKVYGLRWDGNETYTRLEGAVGMVANAGIGTTPEVNDFDDAEIYKDIEDVTVDGNAFVMIPKFYIKKVVTGNTWEWYVSKDKGEGYYLPECFHDIETNKELDYVLIGKYDASLNGIKLASKSGDTPTVDISIDTARTYATNNNENGVTGYQLFDIHAYDAIQVLFYIEYATINSQNIMYGYAASSNSAKINNGTTDIVVSTSGSTLSNSDGLSAMKYRGIENLWGNIWQWIDGIYINNDLTEHNIFVNKKPSAYANYSSSDYYYIGYNMLSTTGWISKMGYDANNPFIQLPTEASGTFSTKYGDKYYRANSGNTVMRIGGSWDSNNDAGISYLDVDSTSILSFNGGGTRIMKKPL